MRSALFLFLLGFVLLVYGVFNAFSLPSVAARTIADNYRIIFFHVPAAVSSFVAFTVTFAASIVFLRSEKYKYDILAESSAYFGFTMITATLISGSVWAKVAWGSYWHWDPRETFVLILWFAYAGYLALRASIEDYALKAKYSAIYGIIAFITVPLSYLSSKMFLSLHPTTGELSFDLPRLTTLLVMITAFILIYTAFLILDSKIRIVEAKIGGGLDG